MSIVEKLQSSGHAGRMIETFDIVVVGAGMAGVSVAAELTSAASVLVLEAEARPGSHATGRSAALYAPGYGGGAVRELTIASEAFLRQQDSQNRPFLKPRGGLFIATPNHLQTLDAMYEAASGTFERLDAEAVLSKVSILRRGRVAAGLYDSIAADIDVDLLLQHYLRHLRRAGGQIACEEAFQHAVPTEKGWMVQTNQRAISCAIIVNAGGAWADKIALQAGVPSLGLQPKRRTAALVERPPDPGFANWPAVIAVDESFYFKPDAGLLLVSPAEETDAPPHDAYADDIALAEGIQRIIDVADITVTRAPRAWAGLRTFARDRVPVIGLDERTNSPFFWMAGQGGYGIQTAPAAAQLGAALVLGSDPPPFATQKLITELSPARLHP
jgi:D-arginine dehydrogenase